MSTQPDPKRLMQQALLELRELKTKLNAVEQARREPIAIIGMGCRFPQAANANEFWQLLRNGVDTVRTIPEERWNVAAYYDPDPDAPNKMYTRQGGYLDEVFNFDAAFFGIPPREAVTMDPQQRLLLEVSWEALEDAGLAPERLAQSETGVYIGYMNRDYVQRLSEGEGEQATDPYILTGNSFSFIAGRLSYLLGLQGPSMVVASACSSSLVTVHLACQALRNNECDLALAGGVNLILHPAANIMLSRLRALSADGRCKTFDAAADGYGRGEGCGMVVLKRLSSAIADGDTILGVIRGSAVNHDGPSAGLTVPNGAAQEKLLRKALAAAAVSPAAIDYIEAHGTGTPLGDPIEIKALVNVFGQQRTKPLWVGSAKTNVGHLEAAAGVVGLIKVLLAFRHETIPPHLHFQQPNPYIAWEQIPIQVTDRLTPWPKGDRPRLAGVSSFGLSGINAHLILEEAPTDLRLPIAHPKDSHALGDADPANPKSKIQNLKSIAHPLQLLTLSAKSAAALKALQERYIGHFAANPQLDLAAVCFTANTGRDHFAHRASVVAATLADAQAALQNVAGSTINTAPKVAFLFTGQGAQAVNMGRELYVTHPLFRQTLARCDAILQEQLGESILAVLYPDREIERGGDWNASESKIQNPKSNIDETAYTQPALFALEYALATLWQAWGVQPAAVMGHSVGEYVAACVAGVFSLEDGLKLIAARARLMNALPATGAMAAIMAPVAVVADAIASFAATVALAAVNGPQNVVISGEQQAVAQILQGFTARGIKTTRLTVSHAFHSPLMEPMLAPFAEVAAQIRYAAPQIALISNVTGTAVREEVATPAYWCQHVRQPVLFAAGMRTLAQRAVTAFVEIGPKPVLLGMGRQCLEADEMIDDQARLYLPSLRPEQEWRQLLTTAGALYEHGVALDWLAFHADSSSRRVTLPTYPFQRKRYVGFAEDGGAGFANKSAQTPLVTLLNQGDADQLAQLITEKNGLSPEQQALVPEVLAALIRQQQTQLALLPTANGVHETPEPAEDDATNNPAVLWQRWQNTPSAEQAPLLATALEEQIARVLGYHASDAPPLAHTCSLLELGLDSLMGVELRNWAQRALNVELAVVDLLSGPSIDGLARQLHDHLCARLAGAQATPTEAGVSPVTTNGYVKATNGAAPLAVVPTAQVYPLTHGQQALWFIQQSAPENSAYNVGLAFRIGTTLDSEALRQSFQVLVNRHAALRTTFVPAHLLDEVRSVPAHLIEQVRSVPARLIEQVRSVPAHLLDEVRSVPTTAALGDLVQVVHPYQAVDFVQIEGDWSPAALQAQVTEAYAAPFDLAHGPLMRVRLFRSADQEQVLLLTFHHIICDAWSTWTLLSELWALYPALKTATPLPPARLAPPTTSYGDFSQWQQTMLTSAEGERLWHYWREQLADAQTILDLPTDYPRPALPAYRGASHTVTLQAEVTQSLRALARAENVTLYMILLAAYQTLLHRYTGQDDILVGSAMAGRNQPQFADVVGYFVNPVVMRGRFAGNPTFQAMLQQVRATVLGALAHQDYPYPLLVARLQPKRDPSRSPLFQVDFTLQKLPPIAEQLRTANPHHNDGLQMAPFPLAEEEGQFDLSLHLFDEGDRLRAVFKYSTDLFAAATIERMAGHFMMLLHGIIAHPQARLGELPLLTAVERQQLLFTWNETQNDKLAFSLTHTVHQIFEAQVEQTPEAVAVVYEKRTSGQEDQRANALAPAFSVFSASGSPAFLSYRELNGRANQLAHYLRGLGVGPEALVGVCLERTADLVVAILAVLKAGGAYVPLDPTYPAERLAFMVEDAGVQVLLTHQHLADRLPAAAPLLCLDGAWPMIAQQPAHNPAVALQAHNLAYVIYTSGSTGKPKGALIEHKGLSNYLAWCVQAYEVATGTGAPVNSSIGFDATITSFFSPLLVGGQVVLLPETDEIEALCAALTGRSAPFSLVKITPAHLEILSHLLTTAAGAPPPIKANAFIIGGEALFGHHLAFWQKHAPHIRLINEYGPTETVVGCCIYEVDAPLNGAALIGRPIANTQLYILDAYGQPVPVGVTGELYIGGAGVARGYLNRPELTAERFIADPFSPAPSARLYKTGDLARYRPDGNIDYLGRRDHQVKIRGYRIELGEVEAVLAHHPLVREVAVLARTMPTGDKQLVAYLCIDDTATDGQTAKINRREGAYEGELRRYVQEKLPEHMVPSHFVTLPALPLTANGKLDRTALPAPTLDSTAHAFVPPRNRVEMKLTTIWNAVLGLPQVGVHDNFFELGGNSLLAVRLVAQIQQAFGKSVPLAALFQQGSVEQLATLLQQQESSLEPGNPSPVAPIQTAGAKPPFFCVPGAGGYVIYLYQLARGLGSDQPFYGLQAAGLEGREPPHTTVEAMAAYYVEAIRAVQPEGPYYLGGHSLGGWVAFEMAQQLERQGQPVALVAIIDTPAPELAHFVDHAAWDDARWLVELAYRIKHLLAPTLEITYEAIRSLSAEEQLRYLQVQLTQVNLFPAAAGLEQLQRLLAIFKAHSQVRYTIPATVAPMPLALFRTQTEFGNPPQSNKEGAFLELATAVDDPTWGWGAYGPTTVDILPGDHLSILNEPHVHALAARVAAALAQAKQQVVW